MEALNLNIKNRILIDFHSLGELQIRLQILLRFFFDLPQLCQNCRVILIGEKFFQLHGVFSVSRSDQLRKVSSEPVVAVLKPSAEGNSVGLIIKFLRIDIIEGLQL